ncbi:glucose 1-dehydrogenase [Eggerthellaceae bacterium zg-893]|nr:glucose 1-dehydrogenase [Eggerthellaceae bacterium zg-893]
MAGMCNYDGKVVIVTGARSGIGAATAKKFALLGAKVVCAGRRPCTDTVEAIKAGGGEAITINCDVANEEDVKNLIAKTVEAYGKLDVLVNNAGSLPPTRDLVDQTVEDFDHTMDVDVKGVFLGMKYGIPAILEAGGGAVVNICSVAGLVADPGMAPYVAAKHAVVGLTRAAGIEYAGKGVRVNGIAPGFVASEMTQGWMDDPEMKALVSSYNWQNRIADPSEIASVAAFLASDEASFMGAAIVAVDAGQTAH